MGRINIEIAQYGEEKQITMGLEEGLKIVFAKSKCCSEDEEKEKVLIGEIERRLEAYIHKNNSLVLLEVKENEKDIVKITIE
ncbi:MAG: hypothetical protein IJY63_05685 [Clostridia bacterium]|nr:hypothetical protein [Clostridia bacterium]